MATQISRQYPGARAAALRPLTEEQSASGEAQAVRFDAHQRIQHFLMMSSFIVLALTGLPQRFSELGLSQWWVETLGGLQTVRTIHRVAAFVMLGDCVYHVTYLFSRIAVQRKYGCFRMVPTFKDLSDAVQTVRYFLGLATEKPKFGRFNYLEKFDYWAVFWGIAIIGGSGLILLFPVAITRVLPGEAVSVALVIHADEAILAVGWILVMHMFNVHLAPWVFPFNPAIFTGKLSARRYAEDHPLEWASMEAAGGATVTQEGEDESAGLKARVRSLVVLVGEKARPVRAQPLLSLLAVVGLVLAGPLGWASGRGDDLVSPDFTPTPTAAARSPDEADPRPTVGPASPAPLTHTAGVVQGFGCANCHRSNSGWLLAEECEKPSDQSCASCHAPEPEPSPVMVHYVPGDTLTSELCTLCHGGPELSEPHLMPPRIADDQACSSCHTGDENAEPPADHAGRSVATCSLCHETQTLAAGAVSHKIEGWEECSFCHGVGRLAPVEGAHDDLADDGCLSCHSPSLLAPQPAHELASPKMCALCHAHSANQESSPFATP